MAIPRPDPLDPNYGVDGRRVGGEPLSPEASKRWAERFTSAGKSGEVHRRNGITKIQAHGITHMLLAVLIMVIAQGTGGMTLVLSGSFSLVLFVVGAAEIQQE